MNIVPAILARLAAYTPHAGRPTVSPPSDYLIVEQRTPSYGPRQHAGTPSTVDAFVTITAVSRDRDRCQANLAAAALLLDDWRPDPAPHTGQLRRYDASDVITPDAPASDVRHSQTAIYRCAVPRVAAPTP